MRIAGYIEHPLLKITIFQMDNRFTVKFEDGTLEQAYKFRSSDSLHTAADVRRLVDGTFIDGVLAQMKAMQGVHASALSRFAPADLGVDEPFDEII